MCEPLYSSVAEYRECYPDSTLSDKQITNHLLLAQMLAKQNACPPLECIRCDCSCDYSCACAPCRKEVEMIEHSEYRVCACGHDMGEWDLNAGYPPAEKWGYYELTADVTLDGVEYESGQYIVGNCSKNTGKRESFTILHSEPCHEVCLLPWQVKNAVVAYARFLENDSAVSDGGCCGSFTFGKLSIEGCDKSTDDCEKDFLCTAEGRAFTQYMEGFGCGIYLA